MRDMRNRLRGAPVVAALTIVSLALGWGCSTADDRLGVENARPAPGPFAADEAGADAREGGLVTYCPSSKCPPGWTTCPNSRFPCDVNLRTDPDNCGACAAACPGDIRQRFVCVEGACKLQCDTFYNQLDCDGLADNGCETYIVDDNNCGQCGKKCTDPAKPCSKQTYLPDSAIACGCPPGKISCSGQCLDPNTADLDCGRCGNQCDRTGGGAPSYPNTYYGCVGGECGGLKCEGNADSCDGLASNGCETSLVTNENCGGCGNVCPAGQTCRIGKYGAPECMCPAGLTYCEVNCQGGICNGECVDLTSNLSHCGACFTSCYTGKFDYISACNYGTCSQQCRAGRADCNNSDDDGCEVDTNSDPRNCGGCGRTCDAVAGQACVAGRCVVEPCDDIAPDAAPGAR